MRSGFAISMAFFLLVGMSQAATMLTDSGSTVETITSLDQIDQILKDTQWFFWKLVPPATDDPFYLHPDRVVRVVDWDSKDWPKPFLKQMYAQLVPIGNYGAMYPFYRLTVIEDRSGDTVFYNSYNQEVWRISAPKDYNPYLFAFLAYGVDSADNLTSMQKIFGRSSNVGTEIWLLPSSFASLYEEDAAMDSSAMRLATAPSTTTTSSAATMTTLSDPGIPGDGTSSTGQVESVTNVLAKLTFHVPSDFGSSTAEIFQCTNLVNVTSWDIGAEGIAVTAGTDRVWTDITSSNIPGCFYILNDPSIDTDGDGLNDGRERYVWHTDPHNRDSDFDGPGDGFEVLVQGSDPLNPDTDGDGVADGSDVHPLTPGPRISFDQPGVLETVTNNEVVVEGSAVFEGTVQSVLIGGEPAGITQTSNGCVFSGTVSLDKEGTNTFYVQAFGMTGGEVFESEARRTVVVDAQAPALSVLSCSDGDVFTNLYVHFKVLSDDPATVNLNGAAMARDGFMNYGWAELVPGTNSVVFDSTDSFGRSSTNTLTVVCNVPVGYTETAPVDTDQDGVVDSADPAPNDPSVQGDVTISSIINGSTLDFDSESGSQSITVSGSAPALSSVAVTVGGVTKVVTADASGNYSVNMQLQPGLNSVSASGSGFESTAYVTTYIPPPRLEFLLTWSAPLLSNTLHMAYSSPGHLTVNNGQVVPDSPTFTPSSKEYGNGYVKAVIENAAAGSYMLDMQTTSTYLGHKVYDMIAGKYIEDTMPSPTGETAKLMVLSNGRLAYLEVQTLWITGTVSTIYQPNYLVEYRLTGLAHPWDIGHFVVHSGAQIGGYVVEDSKRQLAPQAGHMGYTHFNGIGNLALSGPNGTDPVRLLPGQAAQFTLEGDYTPASSYSKRAKLNAAFSGPVDDTGVFLASTPGHYQVGVQENLVKNGSGVYYTSNSVPPIDVYVIAPKLVPDYDRNGTIDEADEARCETNEVFRFWINDDDDDPDSEVSGNDLPGALLPLADQDWHNETVDGTRDLIDFFPICVQLDPELRDTNKYGYYLKASGYAVNFVYTTLAATNTSAYLTDPSVAGSLAHAGVISISSEGTLLDNTDFLSALGSNGSAVLLMEAGTVTHWDDAPLTLEIKNKNSGEVVATAELPLQINGVESYYNRVDLRPIVENWPDGVAVKNPADRYVNGADTSKDFVFVHGYNVNDEQARGWFAEMFKRLYWSGSTAEFHGVSWVGDETQVVGVTPNYHVNVTHAYMTAPSLAEYINNIGGADVLAAHSLGNMVCSAAIANYSAQVGKYFMMDAAVAIEAYDPDPANQSLDMVHCDWGTPFAGTNYPVGYYTDFAKCFHSSEWYKLFPSDDWRSRLHWSSNFVGVASIAYNFYSSGEEVLQTHPHGDDPGVFDIAHPMTGNYAWALQEKLKGRMWLMDGVLGSTYGGWGFNAYYNEYVEELDDIVPLNPAEPRIDEPFFKKDPNADDLYNTNVGAGTVGSNYAQQHYGELLATEIPARSLPAGANRIPELDPSFGESRNYNMNNLYQSGWPEVRLNNQDKGNRWLHGDAKDISYQYIHKLFDTFVQEGALK